MLIEAVQRTARESLTACSLDQLSQALVLDNIDNLGLLCKQVASFKEIDDLDFLRDALRVSRTDSFLRVRVGLNPILLRHTLLIDALSKHFESSALTSDAFLDSFVRELGHFE